MKRNENKTPSEIRSRARAVVAMLRKEYPDSKCALDFADPLELLVATILSAQCTDVRVNLVTRDLFRKYRTASDYAEADPVVFEGEIRSTGFFRSKTKSILAASREILERHGGKVPKSLEELTSLPGVGRKTANVVLGNAFGIPGIAVDTHVKRVAARLGLTEDEDPDKIEQDLCAVVPRKEWTIFSHRMIEHGRRVCHARKPECGRCVLLRVCVYGELQTS